MLRFVFLVLLYFKHILSTYTEKEITKNHPLLFNVEKKLNQFLALCFTTILAIHNLRICQATHYMHGNNVKGDHLLQRAVAPATHYYKLDVNEAVANKEGNRRPENILKFHNIQKSGLNHHQSVLNYETYEDMQPINNPSKLYTSLDYNAERDNDVDEDAFEREQQQKQQQQQIQYQQYDDSFEYAQQEKPSLLEQLHSQHQDLSEGYAVFLQEPYQVVAPPKAESGSSNEQQYLTAYATPAPRLNSKIHLNLQHQQQLQQPQHKYINKPKIVSNATGGTEAAPPTSKLTSIKSHNVPQYSVKYATTNELNAYDNINSNKFIRQPALEYGQPGAQSRSKQYFYAPMRSPKDNKLPYSSKTLPYPPSFISFTTTENPSYNYYSIDHKSANRRIPDLFAYRRSKSLLDSYIPSWQVTKMLQQYELPIQGVPVNSNLHTLAFAKPYKTYHKREVNKVNTK